MGVADGTVIGITKILDNGPASDRFNIVLVAEGYQAAELPTFALDAQHFLDTLVGIEPFPAYQSALNVYRLDVASNESGADDPGACGGSGATPHTFFDARFCNGGIHRLTSVDSLLVIDTVDGYLTEWDQILVIINSPLWGGSGGSIATTTTAPGWATIPLHELGHSAFALADEYEYWAGCGADAGHDVYSGGEPAEVNVTINTDRATIKWGDLIDPTTLLPTTENANCAQCDLQPSPVPAGTVGAFEGAGYFHCGLYRPEYNCMMRNLADFCAVCEGRIKEILEPYMPDTIHVPWEIPPEIFEHYQWRHVFIPRWMLVAYLLVNWRMKGLVNEMRVQPSKQFYETVTEHLSAYINKNKMPPAPIASDIINLADDFMANRPMNLRAGDYLAIQKFIRSQHRS